MGKNSQNHVCQRAEIISSLYRSLGCCADHHDDETLKSLHVRTHVEDYVKKCALAGQVVFVTGNPGDGKTHLIRTIEKDLAKQNIKVCTDANESPDDELIKMVDRALASRKGLVMAINEGILVDLINRAGSKRWVDTVKDQLLHSFVYDDQKTLGAERLVVIDLNLRNTLAPSVVKTAIERMLQLVTNAGECPNEECIYCINIRRLQDSSIADRICMMLAAIGRSGFHATMRDLFGFLSFLVCGGSSGAGRDSSDHQGRYYYDNAFEGGKGLLFGAVRDLDPLYIPTPFLDDRLWRYADTTEDWTLPLEMECRDSRNIEAYKSRKRRALFEHKQGDTILTTARDEVDKLFTDLIDQDRATPVPLIRLLNKYFGHREDQADTLHLWTTHRYDARPDVYAAARWMVPAKDLRIRIPQLPRHLKAAFPEFFPDHVYLTYKDGHLAGMRIDRKFLKILLSVAEENGIVARNGETTARIAAFFDQLAMVAKHDKSSSIVRVRMIHMNTGSEMSIGVDLKKRSYVLS